MVIVRPPQVRLVAQEGRHVATHREALTSQGGVNKKGMKHERSGRLRAACSSKGRDRDNGGDGAWSRLNRLATRASIRPPIEV